MLYVSNYWHTPFGRKWVTAAIFCAYTACPVEVEGQIKNEKYKQWFYPY